MSDSDDKFREWFGANEGKLRLPWNTDSLRAAWEAGRKSRDKEIEFLRTVTEQGWE
jgi:hypothetical protein